MVQKRKFVRMVSLANSNRSLRGLLCAFLVCTTLASAAQPTGKELLAEIAEMEQKAATGKMEAVGLQSGASLNFDIHHYRCAWKLDPAVRFIEGVVTAAFRMKETGNSVTFDLVDHLQVDSVFFRGAKTMFNRPGNHTLRIDFPINLSAGTADSLTIYYQGVPPTGGGFGTFANASHSGVPVMWTLSEPYGSMEWWPCKNGLNDKADSIDVTITTPDAYTGISNGMLVAETTGGGYRTVSWKHRYPIASYLVAIAATNYVTLSDSVQLGSRTMPIIQYAYPESAATFKNAAALTARTLKLLHDRFGDYPFIREKYGHTQFSWGGGMEHQTNSFMINVNEILLVHEAAHQWFGNQVTCGSWQDIWLNEGFAVFLTNYSIEQYHPETTLFNTLRGQLNLIVSQPGGSVFVYDTTSAARIFNARLTYYKGAWLVHMLRWKLGDSAFFRGLRSYLQDPATRYGFARTADLQRNLETQSGQSLTEFFDDWLYGEGYPSYQLTWTDLGNGLIRTSLGQTSSHPSVPFFEMPVPIRFKNAQKDTIVVIDHQQQAQSTYLRLGFTPDSAFIDPKLKLVSAGNTVEKIELPPADPNTAQVYPNPIGNSFNILLRNFQPGPLSLALFNNLGQLLWRQESADFRGSDIIQVRTETLPAGLYWLSMRSGNKVKLVKKLMK
jgi:aminopeptidase N